ncbi:MAG: hypothetical protein KF729_35835 [Sandaracinaceae bacterium]|nr:hypothetical protein [Sandaracinaceae bacterium]
MGKVGQTPGVLLLKPGDAGYDAACAAALKACGIDPGSFDSYTGRCKAIEAAGDKCKANGVTARNLTRKNCGDYLTSQAQSGHMAQNAIFQGAGGRNDPCTNVPPASFNDPSAPSSYGYSMGGAPCTDHFGRSTLPGGCHGEISLHGERAAGWSEAGFTAGQSVNQSQMEDRVRASARIHVDADRTTRSQPRDAAERAKVEQLRNAQRQNAERLSAGDPAAQELLNPSGAKGKKPAGASTPGPSKAVKDFAAECEVTKWKQGMAAMRAKAINESPLGQAAKKQSGKNFTEMSQAEQRRFVNQNPQFFGAPPPSPSPTAQRGVPAPPASTSAGAGGSPPTRQSCTDFQGNYLAWQTANNPSGRARSTPGQMPGWQGRAPAGAAAGPPAGGGGGTRTRRSR